jgi:serine/threonine protein kinase
MSGKIGTVRYMAPECLLEKHYNQKVDTYSWAILFWQMLTLEKPYGGLNKDDHEAFVCRKGYRPKLNPKWPNSLKVLIKKSWAQKMEDRLTMMDVMTLMERIEEELASILQHHRSRVLQSLVPRTISFTRSSGGATCPLGSREKNILLA